jgi:hypothetical protein
MRSCLLGSLLLLVLAPPCAGLAALPDPERLEMQLSADALWQRPLDAALSSAPLGVDGSVAIALESALELRRAEDGTPVWRLEELAGALIDETSFAGGEDSSVLGVALPGPPARFALVDLAKGRVVAETPLPAAALAGPVAVRADSKVSELGWLVSLKGGLVVGLDPRGAIISRYDLGEEIRGAAGLILGFPVAWRGDPARLVTLEGQRAGRHVRSPRGEAARSRGRWLAAPAESGALRTWSCRERRGERLRCKRRWTQRLGGRVLGRPLVGDERIIAG